jgi:parallel beta-helix repeat protein
MDDRIRDVIVVDNTVANCQWYGYHFHNNQNLTVRNNTAFNNGYVQIALNEDFRTAVDSMSDNVFQGNIAWSNADNVPCLNIHSNFAVSAPGTFDSNAYCDPYTDQPITRQNVRYNLAGWQAISGMDAASTSCPVRFQPYTLTDTLGSEMIANGSFSTGISGWGIWPGTSRISWDTAAAALKVSCPHDGVSQPIAISNTFALQQDAQYYLRFSARAPKYGTVSPVVRQAYSPWASRGLWQQCTLTPEWKEYTLLFTATVTDTPCRIDFSNGLLDSLYWLDNVSLLKVIASPIDPLARATILLNPTMQDSQVQINGSNWRHIDGTPAGRSETLLPFGSLVLYLDPSASVLDNTAPRLSSRMRISAYPNPFSPMVTIHLDGMVRHSSPLEAGVYDLSGKLIKDLTSDIRAGIVVWNTQGRSPGIYMVRIKAGGQTMCQWVALVK